MYEYYSLHTQAHSQYFLELFKIIRRKNNTAAAVTEENNNKMTESIVVKVERKTNFLLLCAWNALY